MALPTKMPNLMEHSKVASSVKSPKPAITFLDLPPEISHMIATLLEKEQLPTLRLISKQAYYCFSNIFAKVHFAHLRHHLTEPSLYDLIQITKHAMFSTCVKSIEFSTARTKTPSPESLNPLLGEYSDFRRDGHHITMLTTALENLQSHGNHKVSLGVFDSLCQVKADLLRAFENVSTRPMVLGHGYVKSYGVESMPTGANPYGTMFAISKAAKSSRYSLERLSITTGARSSSRDKLIKWDQANVLHVKGSNCFKSNLTLKHAVVELRKTRGSLSIQKPYFTVTVQTGTTSHLSLQGQTWALNDWTRLRFASYIGYSLRVLPSVITRTKYRKLTLKKLHFIDHGMAWLCSRTKKQTFKSLEIRSVDVWVNKDIGDLGPSAYTFLHHFKTCYKIKKLRISNLFVNASFNVSNTNTSIFDREYPQPLQLAAHGIVAEGYDQVQEVFDDLIAQTLAWHRSIGGN